MLRDIVEVVGPFALKVVAAAACFVVFAPLLVALVAPVFN
jgi:hypothetical protein